MPINKQTLIGLSLSSLLSLACTSRVPQAELVRIFAATSASSAVEKALEDYRPHKQLINTAASSLLAHQVKQGAPADIFISADQNWMEWLRSKDFIEEASINSLFSNQLVVVSHNPEQAWPPSKTSERTIAIADPAHVPLGRYTKEALLHLELWEALSARLVQGKDARATLVLAERGEADLAVVYKTDAEASHKTTIISELSLQSTRPITYLIAILKGQDRAPVREVYRHLITSTTTYTRLGFLRPQ